MKRIISAAAAIFLMLSALCSCSAAGGILPERISIYMKDSGRIITEEYSEFIAGCVFGWISPASEREAIKAAACAISTLALHRMNEHSGFENSGADITAQADGDFPFMTDEQITEEYGSAAQKYIKKVRECTQQAICCAITYDGEPIRAAMCRISAGKTDDGSLPCLAGVPIKCDEEAEGYESTCALSPLAVRKMLTEVAGEHAAEEIKLSGNGTDWFSEAEYADSGTLGKIKFGGKCFSGEQLKNALELRSTAITVSFEQDKFLFTCHGWGDNMGMSMNCAQALALSGMKMEEILGFFYSGAELTRIG